MIQSVEKNDIQLTVHTLCTHITNFVSIQCDKVVLEEKYLKLSVHYDITKVNKCMWTFPFLVFYSIDSLVVIDNVTANTKTDNVHHNR